MDSPETNPYAPPKSQVLDVVGDEGVWRKGKLLVMLREAELPDRCIYCNEATRLRKDKRVYYLNPWLSVILVLLFVVFTFLALLPVILAVLIFRKTARLDIPLCQRHWKNRLILTIAAYIALATSIGSAIISIGFGELQEVFFSISIAVFGIGVVLSIIVGQMLRPKKIDGKTMILKGAKAPFLDSLPEYIEEQGN